MIDGEDLRGAFLSLQMAYYFYKKLAPLPRAEVDLRIEVGSVVCNCFGLGVVGQQVVLDGRAAGVCGHAHGVAKRVHNRAQTHGLSLAARRLDLSLRERRHAAGPPAGSPTRTPLQMTKEPPMAPAFDKISPPKKGTRVAVDAAGRWTIPDDPVVVPPPSRGAGRLPEQAEPGRTRPPRRSRSGGRARNCCRADHTTAPRGRRRN